MQAFSRSSLRFFKILPTSFGFSSLIKVYRVTGRPSAWSLEQTFWSVEALYQNLAIVVILSEESVCAEGVFSCSTSFSRVYFLDSKILIAMAWF